MTTPRPHAELAARYYADDTLKCWTKDLAGGWIINPTPLWFDDCEYHVGHEPPPIKRTITLVVNGRTWVLPEPFKTPPQGDPFWYVDFDGQVRNWRWNGVPYEKALLSANRIYATEADAQAWAEFDKWCRGGGDG